MQESCWSHGYFGSNIDRVWMQISNLVFNIVNISRTEVGLFQNTASYQFIQGTLKWKKNKQWNILKPNPHHKSWGDYIYLHFY